MKKLFLILLAIVMVVSFSACGSEQLEELENLASELEEFQNSLDSQEQESNSSKNKGFNEIEVPEEKRVSDIVITELKTDKKEYSVGEAIRLKLTWTGTPDSNAWVGIIPAEIPHGDEYVNDDADLHYIYLEFNGQGEFYFEYELEPGKYTLRVNENDDGGAELAWCEFTVSGKTAEEPEEDNEESSEPVDANSVAGFLETYGYTEEDIIPAHFISFEELKMDAGEPGEIGSTGFIKINIESGATTQEDFDAWFEKIFAKMTELSKDGKLYNSYLLDTEATPLSELQASPVWSVLPGFGPYFYTYDLPIGNAVISVNGRYDTQKDSYSMSIAVLGFAP